MDTVKMAIWLSRIIRWGLGIAFTVMAYQLPDAKVLYIVGPVIFLTGFLKPQGCIAGACYTEPVKKPASQEIVYEEIT